ncbi:hypothetical protein ABK040_005539 [Willaertia magna]
MSFNNFTNNNEQEMVNQFQNISLSDNNNNDSYYVLSTLPSIVQGINAYQIPVRLDAVTKVRKLLSIEKNPPIDAVLQSGILPKLVEFLSLSDYPPLQFESVWAITNIASGSSEHTQTVVKCGVVPILIQLLQSPTEDVVEQSIWALGNIAGDSAVLRDYVLQSGVMQPLLNVIQKYPKTSIMRNSTWTLSNLFRGKPIPSTDLVLPALSTLAHLLFHTDEEVICDAAWAFSYFSDGPNDRIQVVIETNIVRRLIELLMHHNASIVSPTLRTCGNIATGNDCQTQILLNANFLLCLNSLLSHSKASIRKEACWTISNIAAGSNTQIQSIIEANLIPRIIDILSNPNEDFAVKKEALWAISNLFSGGNEQQKVYTLQQGCLPPIVNLLDNCKDNVVVNVILETIKNVLYTGDNSPCIGQIEECGGFEKVRLFTNHSNEALRNLATEILSAVEREDTEMN